MQRAWRQVAWGIVLAGGIAVGACSPQPASIKELASERALADSLVDGYTPSQPESLEARVLAARTKTKAFLERHPDDVPASLTFVKLRLAEAAIHAMSDSTAMTMERAERAIYLKNGMKDCIAPLDRAIAKQPKNAEPYYWKALVLGLWEPVYGERDLDAEHSQLPQAIEAASKAVALAPDSTSYRTALASYQMLAGDDAGAIATLRGGKAKESPTLRILEEWERFPLPAGSVLARKETAGIAEWLAMSGLDDAHARVRAYWIPGSADSVRAFYDRKWNGLFWMAQPPRKNEKETLAYFSAAVLFDSTAGYRGLRKEDVGTQALSQAQGISVQLREIRNPGEGTVAAVPFAPGKVVCEILLTNHRRVR